MKRRLGDPGVFLEHGADTKAPGHTTVAFLNIVDLDRM